MFNLASVQAALSQLGFDGWLLYDFRGMNVLARRVLGIGSETILSRRWFYFIPLEGEPRKLVHRIEPHALDHLPGSAQAYLKWQELEDGVRSLVQGYGKVAMEYVPRNANPYVSRVDAGTVELVKSFGIDVVPSGDLIQLFEACWDDEQWQMHQQSARLCAAAFPLAFDFITERIKNGGMVHELEVQQKIMDYFQQNNLITDHPPIVGVGPHSGDPHYAPAPGPEGEIREGQFILIDLWAKLNKPRAVYSDYTWTCYTGKEVPEKYTKVFNIVKQGRDAGIQRVREAFKNSEVIQGWQVDQATRDPIEKAGYGEYFIHRTGHSIGEETHGNGANMDNLETHEQRRVMPRTCFSIEPGIYLPEFGVRSEVDVFVDGRGNVHVTGPEPQQEIVALLAR